MPSACSDLRAAIFDRGLAGQRLRRPFDGNGIGSHHRLVAARCDACVLAIDAAFDETVDRLEKIVAMELGVKSENRAAEQAVDNSLLPRADAEGLRVGPGNMPEGDDRRLRQPLPDHPRREREVIVLHQDDRILGLGLLGDGVGEPRVDLFIELPVALPELRAHERDVAQRPKAFIGKTVVITVLLLVRNPDSPKRVRGSARRNADLVIGVDRFPVGAAAAVSDPGAAAGAHDRLKRRDQAARWRLQSNLSRLHNCGYRVPGWRSPAPRRRAEPCARVLAARPATSRSVRT